MDGEEEELAIFLSWLDTLERTLNQNATLFIPAVFEPFHLLNPRIATFENGIPQPEGAGPARGAGERAAGRRDRG